MKQTVFMMKEELEHLTVAWFRCVGKKKKPSRGMSLFITGGGEGVCSKTFAGEGSHCFKGNGGKIRRFQQILKGEI